MKFFIGARNLSTGQVCIAEVVDAQDFDDALSKVTTSALAEAGSGNFRITAVNEQPVAPPKLSDEFASQDAEPPPQKSALTIVDIADGEVEVYIHHSPNFATEEAAKKSPAARLISIGYRLIQKIIDDEVTEDTRLHEIFRPVTPGVCQVCGCTDENCRQCIEKTGSPCHWVNEEHTLCSACVSDLVAGQSLIETPRIILPN